MHKTNAGRFQKKEYGARTTKYLHIKSLLQHFRDIANAHGELTDNQFRVHLIAGYFGKMSDANIRAMQLAAKMAPIKESTTAEEIGYRRWNATISEAHKGHQPFKVLISADMNINYTNTGAAVRTQELSNNVITNLKLAREQRPKAFGHKLTFINNAYLAAVALYNNFMQQEKIAYAQKFGIKSTEEFLKAMDSDAKQIETPIKEREMNMKNLADIEMRKCSTEENTFFAGSSIDIIEGCF